jgi:hypothetical protein
MGEIRSTLDLVMEKTQGLSLTAEEKERLKEAELVCRGESLARRYLSQEIADHHLTSELSKEDEKSQTILKKTLTRWFLDAFF